MLLQRICRSRLFSLRYHFTCSKPLQPLLSQHTYTILTSNPQKYSECLSQMQLITSLSLPEADTKRKLNIIFSIFNLPEPFNHLRAGLVRLVADGSILTQSDLDRLSKWLNLELKRNSNVTEEDLRRRLRDGGNLELCVERIAELRQSLGREVEISAVSKQIREQFPAVDSKVIYQEIRKEFVNKEVKESKQIWDKLSELKPRLLSIQTNTLEQTINHQQITQGKLRFRFPPEPNGYLHIGHAKAIRTNFETARQKGGVCYLRFDDTNPEKESHEFIESIINEVRWMGYEPDRITYASDYFEQIMGYAHQLIQQGNAYICQTPRQQIHEERRSKHQNPYRLKSKQYSLNVFPNLQQNQTLRLKLDPKASNPTLRDPIIYRRKSSPHPRTGNKHKIYPTYDFTHCISDSIQHIDYSLCSLEFQIRRELYYTILHLLKLYKPIVWQYSRLNIEGTFLSKRKIVGLVEEKEVDGWDDPRLMTLAGLRNKGYSPTMITSFIDKVNGSRSGNQNMIQANVLEIEMRKQLFKSAERTMAVLDPQRLVLVNFKERQIEVPLFPFDVTKGVRRIGVTKQVFIQKESGLKLDDTFGLKYVGVFKVTSLSPHLEAQQVLQPKENTSKTKYLHWASSNFKVSPVTEFYPLVKTLPSGQEIYNKNNTKTFPNALVPFDLDQTKIYQFQRLGYYKFYKGNLICCSKL